MYHDNFRASANAAAIRARFSGPRPPDPCRHCTATAPCSCGEGEAKVAFAMARELVPQIARGPMRIRHADLVVALEDAEKRGRITDLLNLRYRAEACARLARAEALAPLAAAFDALAQAAQSAADARPR